MQKIKKIAIPHRGEIAVRAISTCHELGIKPHLLYSLADKGSLAYRLSPEKTLIGPGLAEQSYLNIPAIIEGAKQAKADAIYPGYGFLSERADFAKACDKNQLIFIGPKPQVLEIFGNKLLARKHAIKIGLPVLPAYPDLSQDLEKQSVEQSNNTLKAKKDFKQAKNSSKDFLSKNSLSRKSFNKSKQFLTAACRMGFPVMIKATGGGGGRGLRIVHKKEDWKEAWESALREVKRGFGGASQLFIEKYLPFARHIEVQMFGSAQGEIMHLFDRDCSVQRKYQKIIEEAPAYIPPRQRNNMLKSAVELLRSVNYMQAGTVEFLYQNNEFYFMEVNPRIQVEHPVTEMILGIDLVRAQILTALGLKPFKPQNFCPRGHSIECRIYAEDMQHQVPVFGTLGALTLPKQAFTRFDMGYESYDKVPEFYDSMLGKLIVYDETREGARLKLKHALENTFIGGLKTNLPFLHDIVCHKKFIQNKIHTQFVEEEFLPTWKQKTNKGAKSLKRLASTDKQTPLNLLVSTDKQTSLNPWAYFYNSEKRKEYQASQSKTNQDLTFKNQTYSEHDKISKAFNGKPFTQENLKPENKEKLADKNLIVSPLPGRVEKVLVKPGQKVKTNQTFVIISSMKMEYTLKAYKAGVVKQVMVREGDNVTLRQTLIRLT